MAMSSDYQAAAPTRSQIDGSEGPLVLEFGTPWCGWCRAAQPLIGQALADYPHVRHIKIEDGRGKRLGRTYGVKLWPTLIFLRDGEEFERVVRPQDTEPMRQALALIADGGRAACQ
jgi:thioredoxin 1